MEELLPGSGLTTVRLKFPAEAAEPVAVSCVAETKVVLRAIAPRNTCDPVRKFVPVIVCENLPMPMLAGLAPTSVGVGFISVTALEALAEVAAALVAVMVTVFGAGSGKGAV